MAEINFPALRAMAEEALPTGRFGCNPAVVLALLDRVEKAEADVTLCVETVAAYEARVDAAESEIARLRALLARAGEACSEVVLCDEGSCSLDEMPIAVDKCRTIAREIEEAMR